MTLQVNDKGNSSPLTNPTPSVGKMEGHTVTLSGQPPVRLDKIKGNSLPFQGFKTATKIDRAGQGMQTSLAASLAAMTRPGVNLNPKALLGGMKSFQTSLDRMARHDNIPARDHDKLARVHMEMAVERLSNSDLQAVYQTFQSADLGFLKAALEAELRRNPANGDAEAALANLFLLEAVVLRDVSERILSVMDIKAMLVADMTAENPEADSAEIDYWAGFVDFRLRQGHRFESKVDESDANLYQKDISPRNLKTMVETSAQAHTHAEKTGHKTTEQMLADRGVRGPGDAPLTARQVGDVLRGSELTMNVDLQYLFGLGDNNGVWQNVFHLRDRGIQPRGPEYVLFRDEVEQSLLRELDGSPLRPNERPSYAALNSIGGVTGAAGLHYGHSVFVLRPDAMRRATYTVDDTFAVIPLKFTAGNRAALAAALGGIDLPGMPANIRDELRTVNSPARKALDEILGLVEEGRTVTLRELEDLIIKGGTSEARDELTRLRTGHGWLRWVRPQLVKCLGDRDANRARTATYDTLENLLPHLDDVEATALIHAASAGNNRLALSGRYIEAQIQGTFVPSRDVGEIRVAVADLLDDRGNLIETRLEKLVEFARANDIKLTVTDLQGHTVDRMDPNRPALVAALNRLALPVISGNQILESMDTAPMAAEAARFGRTHQSTGEAMTRARALLENRAELDARLLSVAANLPGGAGLTRVPLDGAALDHVKARFLDNMEKAVRAARTGTGLNIEEVLGKALADAATKMLTGKIAVMAEVEKLTFGNPAQRAAFTHWVVSASVLSNPDEVRMIHENATAQMARLEKLGSNPSLADIAREFRDGAHATLAVVDAIKREGGNDDFGPDKFNTALNRTAFMSIALLKAKNPELAGRLFTALTSPEIRDLHSLCDHLSGPADRGLGISFEDRMPVHSLGMLLTFTIKALADETGRPNPSPPPQWNLGLASVPQRLRGALSMVMPELVLALSEKFPLRSKEVEHAFPTPLQPERTRFTQEQLRAFHVGMLGVYRQHEETFDGDRAYHGMGHASRAFIFGAVLANMLAEKGFIVDRTALLTAISAHDSGRQGNGSDRWEADSARIGLETLCRQIGIKVSGLEEDYGLGEDYEDAFTEQIVGHDGNTLESFILQSADSLDSGRVAIFDPNYCPFLSTSVTQPGGFYRRGNLTFFADGQLREDLLREVALLQRLTDPAVRDRAKIQALQGLMEDAENRGEIEKAESLREERNRLSAGIRQEFQDLRNNFTDEEYFFLIENEIRRNADKMPLLARYYFQAAE